MTSSRVTTAADHALTLVEAVGAPWLYRHVTHD
jgi:hypothetical protein